jgi:hypothetical protein
MEMEGGELAVLQKRIVAELFHRERVHIHWCHVTYPLMRDFGACDV